MTGPPREVVVGIDVGTTAAKVSAFGVGGGTPWRHTVVREYPLHHPEPAWAIQEPAVVLAAAEQALAQCVADVGAERVIALALSTAMHGVVGLDPRGEPLTPIITWADGRSRSQAQRLRASGQGEALLRASGTPMYAAAPLTKLMWFAEHDRHTGRQPDPCGDRGRESDSIGRAPYRGELAGTDPREGEGFGVPGPSCQGQQAGRRRARHLGHELAGEVMDEQVLEASPGRHAPAQPRVVLGKPHELGERRGGIHRGA